MLTDEQIDLLGTLFHEAWRKYTTTFEEPPHGTLPQCKALVAIHATAFAEVLYPTSHKGVQLPAKDSRGVLSGHL